MGHGQHPDQEHIQNVLADPATVIVGSSLKTGVVCGGIGFLFGGTAGIIKNTTPFLFASAAGIQTFALGTVFSGTRSGLLQLWTRDQATSADLIKASTIAGGLTGGTVATITRGRSNTIPGTVMFALFGFLGQSAVNKYVSTGTTQTVEPKAGFWQRMGEKKWTPFTVLNDEQYVAMLNERLLKIDVELAIVDEKIAALKREEARTESQESLGTVNEKATR